MLLLLVGSASAQKQSESTSFWPTWLGGQAKPTADAKSKPKAAPAAVDRAEELAKLEAAYQRRQQVCDELRRVALETGDSKLEDEALALEEMAWKIFEARSAKLMRLGVVAEPESPEESSTITQTRDMLIEHADKKKQGGRR
jgi:hypothetical protein